VKQEIGLAIEI